MDIDPDERRKMFRQKFTIAGRASESHARRNLQGVSTGHEKRKRNRWDEREKEARKEQSEVNRAAGRVPAGGRPREGTQATRTARAAQNQSDAYASEQKRVPPLGDFRDDPPPV